MTKNQSHVPARGAGVLAVGGPGLCPARLAIGLCCPRMGEGTVITIPESEEQTFQ